MADLNNAPMMAASPPDVTEPWTSEIQVMDQSHQTSPHRLAIFAIFHPMVILTGMTHRVGPKGQVVIPKKLRDELGIEPGDEVSFWRHEDHVALRPAGRQRPLRGRFRGSRLTDELERERAVDRTREAAR